MKKAAQACERSLKMLHAETKERMPLIIWLSALHDGHLLLLAFLI
jgi:hypothetical protein